MLPGPAGLTGLAGGVSEGPGLGAGSGLRGAPWAGGRAQKGGFRTESPPEFAFRGKVACFFRGCLNSIAEKGN